MSSLAVLNLSACLARQSFFSRSAGFTSSLARNKSSLAETAKGSSPKSVNIPPSPFAKDIPNHSQARANKLTQEQHFFKPLLLPQIPEKVYEARTSDYRRSFDRKDVGRKPKALLDIPPIKFAVKEFPEKYTTKPLPTWRTGGRHPVTGRVIYRRIGGGVYRDHFWIDTKREYIPETETIEEKVLEIRSDPQRTGKIALIGHGDHQHWIIATEHMKVGQIVKSSRAIGRMAVRAFEGDTYAIGALPIGTVISSVEIQEGGGAKMARAAGCCAQIVKKEEGAVTVQLPSKRLVKISEKCIATVGRISNVGWQNVDLGSAGAARRMGIRPKSGLWHRKDGYCGRKIRPVKPLRSYLIPRENKLVQYAFSPMDRIF